MKSNQNLPNKQFTSNKTTGKPQLFSHRSRNSSRENSINSRHRSPNKFPHPNSKPYYGNSNFKPPSRIGSPYTRPSNSQNTNYNSRP